MSTPLTPDRIERILANNAAGRAPGCIGCGHYLVVHGAGKCAAPGCDCPSTDELWTASLEPVTNSEPKEPTP